MGLKDRLAQRAAPTAVVSLRIDESPHSEQLHRRRDSLSLHLAAAEKNGDAQQLLDDLRLKLADAEVAVGECYEHITLTALRANEFEAIVSDHPPLPEQLAADPSVYFNRLTFFPALLAACTDADLDADDWVETIESGKVVAGEVGLLISTAMQLNDRSPLMHLGKE